RVEPKGRRERIAAPCPRFEQQEKTTGNAMKFVTRVLLMLLLFPVLPLSAEEFPRRPITLIVPFSAGGPGDVIARLLGSSMGPVLKQTVVIENVVGAGGTLGTNRVA